MTHIPARRAAGPCLLPELAGRAAGGVLMLEKPTPSAAERWSALWEVYMHENNALRAEVARLRAVIAEAAAELPVHPEGVYLTPPEADAEAVRQTLLAAIGGEA